MRVFFFLEEGEGDELGEYRSTREEVEGLREGKGGEREGRRVKDK